MKKFNIKTIRDTLTTISLIIFAFGVLNFCMAVNGIKPISMSLVGIFQQNSQTQKLQEAEVKYEGYTMRCFFKDDTEYSGIVKMSEIRDFTSNKTDTLHVINPSTGKVDKQLKPSERDDIDRIIIISDGKMKLVIRKFVGKA